MKNKKINLVDANGNLREVAIEDFNKVKNIRVYVISGNEAISINRGIGSTSVSEQTYVDPTHDEREIHSLEGYYDVFSIGKWNNFKGNAHERLIEFGYSIPPEGAPEYPPIKES